MIEAERAQLEEMKSILAKQEVRYMFKGVTNDRS